MFDEAAVSHTKDQQCQNVGYFHAMTFLCDMIHLQQPPEHMT